VCVAHEGRGKQMLSEANAGGPKEHGEPHHISTRTLPSRSSIRGVSCTQANAHRVGVNKPPWQQRPHRFTAFSEFVDNSTHHEGRQPVIRLGVFGEYDMKSLSRLDNVSCNQRTLSTIHVRPHAVVRFRHALQPCPDFVNYVSEEQVQFGSS